MSGETTCALCAIAADANHPHHVGSDRETVTILNHRPAIGGHLLVLPRRHVPDVWACEPGLYQAVYAAVQGAALLLRDRLDAAGATIVEAVRGPGWQSIPHLHVHVLPRWDQDELTPIWRARRAWSEGDLAAMRDRLRFEA